MRALNCSLLIHSYILTEIILLEQLLLQEAKKHLRVYIQFSLFQLKEIHCTI